jgi:hypothetical protein
MTPTTSMNTTSKTHRSAPFMLADSPYADTPDQLTFDEMREMPMYMALGFETSIDD